MQHHTTHHSRAGSRPALLGAAISGALALTMAGAAPAPSLARGTQPGPPVITDQPDAVTLCPDDGAASFTIVAAGESLTYQWRRDHVNLFDNPNRLAGARAPTLVLVNIDADDVGIYDCIVSSPDGAVTSDQAALTICRADFNCDRAVTSQDFFDFLADLFAVPPPITADFNRDGLVTSQDFFDFLAAFFAGC